MNRPLPSTAVARFDEAVDRSFAIVRGHRGADVTFYTLTALADHSILWMLLASIQALAPRRRRRAIATIAALGAESLLVNGVVKSLIGRERPIDRDHLHPFGLRYPRTSSFPSGHASSAFAASFLLARSARARTPLLALATLVAASRIYVRIHHASDVVAGAALGTVYGLVACWFIDAAVARRNADD